MLKALSQPHELGHGFSLEFLDVFVLLLKLTVRGVLEGAELEGLVCSLVINLLLQVVLAIVHLLHDVLLALNTRLYLTIELVLKTYYMSIIRLAKNITNLYATAFYLRLSVS